MSEEKKGAGGRPTNWSLELEYKAWEYARGGWQEQDAIPSVVGLCKWINRSRAIIYDWEKHPEKQFSDILRHINEEQERITFNGSLKGDLNAAISKLLLGKHGYKESHDHTSSDGSMSPQKGLGDFYNESKSKSKS